MISDAVEAENRRTIFGLEGERCHGLNPVQEVRLLQGIDEGQGNQHYTPEQIEIIDYYITIKRLKGESVDVNSLVNNYFIRRME